MQIPLILAITAFLGAMAYPRHINTRDPIDGNLARSVAERGGHCYVGSTIDPTTHIVLDKTDDDADISGPIGCHDDSGYNIDARSDSTSASSTAVSDTESSPDSTTQDSTQSPPRQMPLWHDMALLANSTSNSRNEEDNSHCLGYAVLKLMCRASRKIVAVGSVMRINELSARESKELLASFYRNIEENHDLQVRFKLKQPNDLAIRDNRSVFHTATSDYSKLGDCMGHRAVGIGTKPYFDPQSKSRTLS
ncbi:hypothetical protein Q7P35_004908 [Cladosporium inversicolor]